MCGSDAFVGQNILDPVEFERKATDSPSDISVAAPLYRLLHSHFRSMLDRFPDDRSSQICEILFTTDYHFLAEVQVLTAAE